MLREGASVLLQLTIRSPCLLYPSSGTSCRPDWRAWHPTTGPAEEALRKIETALVELDACRDQGAVKDRQVANCREQVETNAAIMGQQAASLEKLNQALAAKDQILSRQQAEYRAELKAARGTLPARVARALKYVGLGVAIGVFVR